MILLNTTQYFLLPLNTAERKRAEQLEDAKKV